MTRVCRTRPDSSVLVVENDASLRGLIAAILDYAGIRSRLAGSSLEAIEAIRQDPPSLVLVDAYVPWAEGEGLYDALRRDSGRSLPVILISAQADQMAGGSVRAFDFLPKPFDIDDLVAKVRRGLSLYAEPF